VDLKYFVNRFPILWQTGRLRWQDQPLILLFFFDGAHHNYHCGCIWYNSGNEAISEKLFEELSLIMGQENASVLEKAINNCELKENSLTGTIIDVGFFLVSATTLFVPCKIPSVILACN
jgi:hypothetical protein